MTIRPIISRTQLELLELRCYRTRLSTGCGSNASAAWRHDVSLRHRENNSILQHYRTTSWLSWWISVRRSATITDHIRALLVRRRWRKKWTKWLNDELLQLQCTQGSRQPVSAQRHTQRSPASEQWILARCQSLLSRCSVRLLHDSGKAENY